MQKSHLHLQAVLHQVGESYPPGWHGPQGYINRTERKMDLGNLTHQTPHQIPQGYFDPPTGRVELETLPVRAQNAFSSD